MRCRALAAALLLAGCAAPSHKTARVTDEQLAQLKPGMSPLEVRLIIGRPWQLIVDMRPNVEEHRYVMERGRYKARYTSTVTHAGGKTTRTGSVPRSQYRVLELTYVDGKLQGPEPPD